MQGRQPLGRTGITPDKSEAASDNIKRAKISFYMESMKLELESWQAVRRQ